LELWSKESGGESTASGALESGAGGKGSKLLGTLRAAACLVARAVTHQPAWLLGGTCCCCRIERFLLRQRPEARPAGLSLICLAMAARPKAIEK